MAHYLDILLRPDPETTPQQLMAALFAKLHRTLVQLGSTGIGVSFPEYKAAPPYLGNTLRLLGTEEDLHRLMGQPWLSGLQDHIEQAAVQPVPAHATHRRLSRVQAKSSPERLRRRQMKRHGLTEQEALARLPDACAETLALPFLMVRSASTEQSFKLFLRCEPASASAGGLFNAYGLSTTATIPWF